MSPASGWAALAVCSNRTHAQMFRAVRQPIESFGGRMIALSLDRYYGQGASEGWTGEPDLSMLLARSRGTASYWRTGRLGHFGMYRQAWRSARECLQQSHPSAVLLGNDIGLAEQALIRAAASLLIPTVLVQEAMTRVEPPPVRSPLQLGGLGWLREVAARRGWAPPTTRPYGAGGCGWIAVGGTAASALFAARGVPPSRIVVTGQPRYDCVPEIARTVPIECSGRTIVYAASPLTEYGMAGGETERALMRSVLQAARSVAGTHRLVVRLHPAQSLEHARELLRSLDAPQVEIHHGEGLLPLLAGSDLVVTYNSTVGLEAMLFGLPVVSLRIGAEPDASPLGRSGAVLVTDPAGAVQAVQRALIDEPTRRKLEIARQAFVREQVGELDGRAGHRVAALVAHVVGSDRAEPEDPPAAARGSVGRDALHPNG